MQEKTYTAGQYTKYEIRKDHKMETIKFTIVKIGNDMCRIVAHDIRSIYRAYEGGCICSMEVMLNEMSFITKDIKEKYGNDVVFEMRER